MQNTNKHHGCWGSSKSGFAGSLDGLLDTLIHASNMTRTAGVFFCVIRVEDLHDLLDTQVSREENMNNTRPATVP